MSPIANYTTQVSAMKSIGEIEGMLVAHGAKSIMINYKDGQPESLAFLVDTTHGEVSFHLPANIDRVQAVLAKERPRRRSWDTEVIQRNQEQAMRVGWRIIKDWIRAQMAIIETDMVKMEQVFLPYMQMGDKTLYEAIEEKKFYLTEGKD